MTSKRSILGVAFAAALLLGLMTVPASAQVSPEERCQFSEIRYEKQMLVDGELTADHPFHVQSDWIEEPDDGMVIALQGIPPLLHQLGETFPVGGLGTFAYVVFDQRDAGGPPCEAELTSDVSCLDPDGNFTIEWTLTVTPAGGAAFSHWGPQGLDILSGELSFVLANGNQFVDAPLDAGDHLGETTHNADDMLDPGHHVARDSVTLEGYIEWPDGTTVDLTETVAIPEDCTPPESIVEVEDEDGTWECDDVTVEVTRTTTTTPLVWDSETQDWVEDTDNIQVEVEVFDRDLTDEESFACPPEEEDEVDDDVLDESDEVGDTVVEVLEAVEVQDDDEELPETGASVLGLLISGLLALFAGGGALRLGRRGRR